MCVCVCVCELDHFIVLFFLHTHTLSPPQINHSALPPPEGELLVSDRVRSLSRHRVRGARVCVCAWWKTCCWRTAHTHTHTGCKWWWLCVCAIGSKTRFRGTYGTIAPNPHSPQRVCVRIGEVYPSFFAPFLLFDRLFC